MAHASPQDRFASKYEVDTTTGCWNWKAGTGNVGRYGRFWYEGRTWFAHNVAYLWWGDQIYEPDLHRDHLCRNTLCVNPDHLEQVPMEENIHRQHAVRLTCPQGHPYDRRNSRGHRFCVTCHRNAVSKHRKKSAA